LKQFFTRALLSVITLLLAAACTEPPLLFTPPAGEPTAGPVEPSGPAAEPTAAHTAADRGAAVEYNLGEASIIQDRFPEDSRFRNMSVRLNGVIAAPREGAGPFPVVVIIHGTHPGCPEAEHGVDRWPCDPEVEQRNYSGFAYLVEALAAQGYVALAPNFNAEHTFGFGEPVPGERLAQVLDLHLQSLAEATAGGVNDFGVDLAGRADLGRLALVGHSRGGGSAVELATNPELMAASRGYGPAAGVLLIAGATAALDPWSSVSAPLATILSACDGDVTDQAGQFFFEGPRLAPDQTAWAASAWLERANHNGFNSILPGDMITHRDRPDCATLLDGEAQRAWLVDYARDFLAALFSPDAATVASARERLGLAVTTPAPAELYGLPARVAFLAPAADRQPVMIPADAAELATSRLGGAVVAAGLTTHFCPKGFYSAWSLPGSEPCRRNYVTVPGQPAHAVVSWEELGAALRLTVPEGAGDLSGYTTLSLRAAVDPASPLNATRRPQAFSVQITDRAGNRAAVQTRPDEPALSFPPGEMREVSATSTGFFTGIVPLTTIRMPLSAFAGVDLSDIAEIALVFDQTPSGALFVGDIEYIRPWQSTPRSPG
jgi:dienelactone hydrolase